ncbi:glycosyltransferase [Priestia megaterium]
MVKFCFVILHYEAIEETLECIASIENNVKYNDYYIIIVDNNSPNNSGVLLQKRFNHREKVFVLLNKQNSGFAKGNNVGYKFAKEDLKVDFIACINNDTLIKDPHFIDKILELYNSEGFHVMGPDIITLDGAHQNPYKLQAISLNDINNYIKNYKKKVTLSIIRAKVKNINLVKKLVNSGKTPEIKNPYHMSKMEGIVLHGSALIFSPLYVEKESYAFYPKTFMFGEEHILCHLCSFKGYKMLYSPTTNIVHKEDASTDIALKTDARKLKFIYKHELQSYKILKQLLESNFSIVDSKVSDKE